ncbi:MAG: DUF5693 family protein [Synergistaceae bacterium]|jgi:hypothetical protein|nr:DUF5693 family protein [Synergistaceae bacterium]
MAGRWDDGESAGNEIQTAGETLTIGDRLEEMKRPFISAGSLFAVLMLTALLLSSRDIYRRLAVEWSHRTVAVAAEYKDVRSLSGQAGNTPHAVFAELAKRGVRGLTVQEFTGRDLANGAMPLSYGPLESFPARIREGVNRPGSLASILADKSVAIAPATLEYLSVKIPASVRYDKGSQVLIVLPGTIEEFGDAGLIPDFEALRFAEDEQTAAIFRPSPVPGVASERVAASIAWLKGRFPSVLCVLPSGQIVAGYPNFAPVAAVLKENGIAAAQAEFVRQVGAQALYAAIKPDILPLHSITRDELISRLLTRDQVVERMVRAVHERSIRLLLMRPYELYASGRLTYFLEDLDKIQNSLTSRGYSFAWPATIPLFTASFLSALATAFVFTACLWFHARRYVTREARRATRLEASALVIFAIILGLLTHRITIISRMLGGVTAALAATEATIWALDKYRKPFAGLIAGLLIVLAGGLTIAAHYGTALAMLRLTPFSGVKLTLLLPPLLILANDLKQRVHPESLSQILRRPSEWGELLLVALLLAAAFILTVRSDNVSSVPGWEISFRDMLERALGVRPRTKEFLVGYPCLVIYHALVRRGWAARYREVFRVGASLAFASAINAFCHFHTLLPLTLIRVVNGWWLGLVVGFVAIVLMDYIGGPIWRKGGREIFE